MMKVQAAVVQAAPIGFDREQTMDKLKIVRPRKQREVSKEMRILSIWESHLPRSAAAGAPR
jgi:hypothetical protein